MSRKGGGIKPDRLETKDEETQIEDEVDQIEEEEEEEEAMQLGELVGICSIQMNNDEHILSCAKKDQRNCDCLKLFSVIPCSSLHPNILFDHHDLTTSRLGACRRSRD